MNEGHIKFLHVVGPDTKNSFGIMQQIHATQDMREHRFLITAYESCKQRFPKLEQFPDNLYIPEYCGFPKRLRRIAFFLRHLRDADVIVWHSLFFTTRKYIWFLFAFPSLMEKSVWVEWNADLYVWEYPETSLRNRIKNYMNRKIRQRFRYMGGTFPVDIAEYKRQFGEKARCFYTPMPNPYKGASQLIETIRAVKPPEGTKYTPMVQIAHNAFTFNNHVYLMNLLKRYAQEDVRFFLPISYGMYGINGQYGSKLYSKTVKRCARQILGDKAVILEKNIPFEQYLKVLWTVDVAVFDFDRPCGLGTLRILLLMGKKIYLPSGSPYYEFLRSQGLPVCDTRRIPEMTFEEFMAPVEYTNYDWLYSYLNNGDVMDNWDHMFREIEKEMGLPAGKKVEMKKVMILGATQTQVPLVQAARNLGCHTIVASIPGDYPAFAYADEVCHVDITDSAAVLQKAQELKIDGITSCCMDMGVRSIGYVCDRMGLQGLTERAALLSNQKLLMKDALIAGGVKTPAYCKTATEDDLRRAWDTLAHPVILKAIDLQASRGIYVCRSFEELEQAFRGAMALTREDYCIVEEFITGIDIGAQAFVSHGEILFVLPHNDEVYTGSANKPIGHSAPLRADEALMAEVRRQSELAIRAMGLDNCPVNIDLLKADDGQIYIIELTGRVGATCLPELVSLYYGINYYEMIVKNALGEDPRQVFDRRAAQETPNASRFITADRTGVLRGITNNNAPASDIAMLELYAKAGDTVRRFEDGKDRIGQVVVTGATLDDCFRRLDEIQSRIVLDYAD